MSLTLYYHPLASFCWKPLIALYENQTAFTGHLVDLGNEKAREEFHQLWPMGEFPVLLDSKSNQLYPQSSVIIEYLNLNYRGSSPLIPNDANLALDVRRWDGFLDTYVHVHMQKIVADCLRPEGKKDPTGVEEARDMLQTSYQILEVRMKDRNWIVGNSFSMADCAAAPALFYADQVEPFDEKYPALIGYLSRLKNRPSFSRVLEEARPYFHYFPYKTIQE